MITGLGFVGFGVLLWFYPQILVALFSAVLIWVGLGMMAASWQFRRMPKRSGSPFINWIIRW
jgi:hypothetical protein